jgi:hypothetical protein
LRAAGKPSGARVAESCADLIGVGVVQIFEDAERLLPGIPCFLRFVGGEVVVA